MPDAVKIKGSVMKDPRDWLRTAYGPDAYKSAINRLKPEERDVIDGHLFAAAWYPVELWDRFLAGMREEVFQRTGEKTDDFNRRFMSETGSAILRGVYRIVLGLVSPTTVVEKATLIYNRAYSQGRCQIVENVPGKAVVRYVDASPELRTNLTNHFPTGMVFVLGLHGAQDVKALISRDEVVDGKLLFEVTLTYREK